jgi:hypothetical protein
MIWLKQRFACYILVQLLFFQSLLDTFDLSALFQDMCALPLRYYHLLDTDRNIDFYKVAALVSNWIWKMHWHNQFESNPADLEACFNYITYSTYKHSAALTALYN